MDAVSRNIEEYLEAIYTITDGTRTVKTTELAHKLKISPASVTEMLQKLSKEGFVSYSPYHGAMLTKAGIRHARKMTRRHRLLECFLHDVLGIHKEKVHEEACKMEHALSDEAETKLCRLLEHPNKCPDDKQVIPVCDSPATSCEDCIKRQNEMGAKKRETDNNILPLSSLKKEEGGKIAFIRGEGKVLRRLLDMGLVPGTEISVIEEAPFKGPIEIRVRQSRLAIGKDIASMIFVEAM
jgi:DtxR family Mn-dependent transcriptional regulator